MKKYCSYTKNESSIKTHVDWEATEEGAVILSWEVGEGLICVKRNSCPRVIIFIFLSSIGINFLIANNIYEAAYPLHDVSTISVGTLPEGLKNLKTTGNIVGGYMRGEAEMNHDIKILWLILGSSWLTISPSLIFASCLSSYFPKGRMNWFYLSFPYTPCFCFWGKCEKAETACKWSKGGDVGNGWMAVEGKPMA